MIDPAVRQHLDTVRTSLCSAADAVADRVIGRDVRSHLQQAARHTLLAGVAAIDAAEARRAKPAEAAAPSEPPAT